MTYFDTHDSFSSSRRVLAAISLSVAVHTAAFASWHFRAIAPALSAIKPIEVTLVTETPRVAVRPTPQHRAPTPRPTPRANPTPAPTETTEPAPPEQSAPPSAPQPVVEARSDVASLNNPPPPYPLAARRQGAEGTALLSVLVRSDGTCAEVRLKQSSGYASLDTAALNTVRRWRFVPGRQGDTPIDTWVDQPIRFSLEKNS